MAIVFCMRGIVMVRFVNNHSIVLL
jgi:hypothetical protein